MTFVTSGNARIHWDAQGEGTPVLLIMGHLYGSQMWYPLLPDLMKRHRVITFDNRGTGDSDTTRGVTIEQMAADALAVLDAAGEPRAHVYGVSMGGGIAGEFAMTWPERCLSVTLGCTALKTPDLKRSGSRAPWVYHMPHWLVRLMAPPPRARPRCTISRCWRRTGSRCAAFANRTWRSRPIPPHANARSNGSPCRRW